MSALHRLDGPAKQRRSSHARQPADQGPDRAHRKAQEHLRLLSPWALPVGNQSSLGAVAWPPPLSVVPNWGVRVRAVGARIPARTRWQIVLRLAPTGSRTGSAAAVTVSYQEAGTEFVMRQAYSPTVTSDRCS